MTLTTHQVLVAARRRAQLIGMVTRMERGSRWMYAAVRVGLSPSAVRRLWARAKHLEDALPFSWWSVEKAESLALEKCRWLLAQPWQSLAPKKQPGRPRKPVAA